MPRIDPLQLLECLSALLARNGGMKSTHDVKRIASLMQKYSKKLVSKCIYIQILKSSETELLGQFMETGGWTMTHSWLEDAINTDNWPLVQEILELFLLCPVDVTRLRSNSAPKLVKNLSKEGKHERVKILSARLVEQWLKLVKGETVALPATNQHIIMDQGFQQNAQQMQLLDPSHPSYADSLAIVGDELGGLGSLGSADIDVDEIIPTISHHHGHHAGMEVGEQEVVDGAFLGTAVSALSEDVSMDGNIVHSSDNHSSLSSNNNVNQNELEKDNLKIKITMKDGKTKVTSNSNSSGGGKDEEGKSKTSSSSSRSERRSGSTSDKERSKDKKSSSSKSASSSSSGHKSSSSSSSKRGHSSSSKSSSSSSSSSKDKDKSRDRDRSSSHKSTSSSSKSSSSSTSRSKESVSQADKDKDTLSKVMGSTSSTMEKLGKIPKKPKTEEGASAAAPPAKKASISIEVCKDPENRPKTVKTFNSQFRNHGLVDDIPPPPSRKTLKKPDSAAATTTTNKSSTSTTGASLKRASPPKDISAVAEKRLKLDQIVAASPTEEKPGGVKLIAPRSKPILIESDMFMDALCSSAVPTAKGNPKKRKRVASTSKDGSPPPPTTPDSPKIVAAPMKFYQDTLDDNQQSAAGDEAAMKEESPLKKAALDSESADDATSNNPSSPGKDGPSSPGENADDSKSPTSPAKSDGSSPDSPAKDGDEDMEVEEDNTPKPPGPGCGPNGPPGVLVLHRRRTAKKSVRWRPQESLEEVRLFELDETERVNVTKTFTDMKQMERFGERDAFQMARKLQNDDVMVEQTVWTHLIEVDDVPQTASGGQSKEKDVQAARELTCLQALYFSYNMIPDSATEPEAETYKYAEPAVIPMEDAQNTVNDFTKQGWPEAKEHGPGGPGMGGLPFNNGMMGSAFDNPFAAGGPFGGGNQTLPFGGPPGIWSAGSGPPPPFGAPNGVPPFNANLNGDEIQLAMNRLAFPGQTFNPPNFNGINMMNLPAMGAGGPMGWGGFRGGPPMGGGGVWRGHGPPQQPPMNGGGVGPRREWTNNNNNNVSSRPCKNHKKGYCKKGDKCNFSHAGPPGGPGGFRS